MYTRAQARKKAPDKSYSVMKIVKMICESNCDRYTNHEDEFLLQQVSIVLRVGVAIPFYKVNEYQLEDYRCQLHKIS